MKQNGFLNLQYLNRSIKYTAFNVIVQYSKQNLQDSWQCVPYKVESLILRVLVRRAWRTRSGCWGSPGISHAHMLCPISVRKEPHFPLSPAARSLLTGASPRRLASAPPPPSGPHAPASCLSHVPARRPSCIRRISQHSTCKRPLPG